jgi:hypothetical protein
MVDNILGESPIPKSNIGGFLPQATAPPKNGADAINIPQITITPPPDDEIIIINQENITVGKTPKVSLANTPKVSLANLRNQIKLDYINAKNQLGITHLNVSNKKSVSFQGQGATSRTPILLNIPDIAEDTWRLTRSNLSNAVRARNRAHHFQYLVENDIIPFWTLGMEPAPAYIREIMPELLRLKKLQAIELMQTAVVELTNRAARCERVGNSLREVTLRTLFGNNVEDYRKAIGKINQLVARDEQECANFLATRRETLREQPITDEMLTNAIMSMEYPPNARRPPTTRPRSRSRSPSNRGGFRGRGSPQYRGGRGYRGRGRGNQTSTSRESLNPNNRDSRPRGRGRGRGSNRSNSRDRASTNQGNTVNVTPSEMAILNALRNNNNQK